MQLVGINLQIEYWLLNAAFSYVRRNKSGALGYVCFSQVSARFCAACLQSKSAD